MENQLGIDKVVEVNRDVESGNWNPHNFFYRETAVRSEIRGMSSLQVCVVESGLEPARRYISKFSLFRWIRVE